MRWAEVEGRAATVAADSARKATLRKAAARKARQEAEIAEQTVRREEKLAEIQRVDGILEKFHVPEVLTAIKDDVWGEGEITESFELIAGYGAGLEAVEYKAITLRSEPIPHMSLVTNNTVFQRFPTDGIVLYDGFEQEYSVLVSLHSEKPFMIAKKDGLTLNLLDTDSHRPLDELVNEYGFREGLRKGIDARSHRVSTAHDTFIDLSKDTAEDTFLQFITDNVGKSIRYKSLPGQERSWITGRLRELPQGVEEIVEGRRRFISRRALRDWESSVTGRSKAGIAFERVTDTFRGNTE